MNVPAISVILPVYNAERFLAEAVESILSQTYGNFELVAINDGSCDGSLELLKKYAAIDDRIRLFSRQNRGLVETLNEGIAYARSHLLARMDADDIALPDRLRKQKQYMDENPDCVALGSAIRLIDMAGALGRSVYYPADREALLRMRTEGSMLAHPAVMLRRDIVRDVGGYRAAFAHAEDYDLWLRLAERGVIHNLPEVLLLYRQHDGQVSVNYSVEQALATSVAQVMADLRVYSGEPVWDTARPLTPGTVDDLPLDREASKKVRFAALQAMLRPGLLVDADRQQDLLRMLSWLMHDKQSTMHNSEAQQLFWSLTLACWRSGGRVNAVRTALLNLRHFPISALRTFLAMICRKLIRTLRGAVT